MCPTRTHRILAHELEVDRRVGPAGHLLPNEVLVHERLPLTRPEPQQPEVDQDHLARPGADRTQLVHGRPGQVEGACRRHLIRLAGRLVGPTLSTDTREHARTLTPSPSRVPRSGCAKAENGRFLRQAAELTGEARLHAVAAAPSRPLARCPPVEYPLDRLVCRAAQHSRGTHAAGLFVGVDDVQLLPRSLQWRSSFGPVDRMGSQPRSQARRTLSINSAPRCEVGTFNGHYRRLFHGHGHLACDLPSGVGGLGRALVDMSSMAAMSSSRRRRLAICSR